MAEANSEVGALHFHHKLSDRLLFGTKPRILVFLPHVLRSAHDEHDVEWIKVGDVLALIEFDGVNLETILTEEVAENPWMLDGGMLQDDQIDRRLLWHRSYPLQLASTLIARQLPPLTKARPQAPFARWDTRSGVANCFRHATPLRRVVSPSSQRSS